MTVTDSTTVADDGATEPTPLKILTLTDILAVQDLPQQLIELPEWGGAIRIQAISRQAVRDIYRRNTDKDGTMNADAVEQMLVMAGTVDPKIRPDDFKKLQAKNAGPIARLIDAIMGLSGLDKAALERARESFRDG